MATRKPSRLVLMKSPRSSEAGAKATAWTRMAILPYFSLRAAKSGVDLSVVRDVALEAGCAGQLVDEALGLELHALILVADGQGCAGLVEFLGDSPGDGTLVGQPEDHGRLTRQIDHAFLVPRGPAVGLGRTGQLIGYQPGTVRAGLETSL